MAELWRDIPGFEDYYQVSNNGNVRTAARTVEVHAAEEYGGFSKRKLPERLLAMDKLAKGWRVILRNDETGARSAFDVARLVLYAFHGMRSGCDPCFKDGDVHNSRSANLMWKRRFDENAQVDELLPQKDCNYKKVLTEDEVSKAFTDMRENSEVAKEIGISPLCVELIKKRIIWTQYTEHLSREKRAYNYSTRLEKETYETIFK